MSLAGDVDVREANIQTRGNARLTRRFGAAKQRKTGRCAADCYVFLEVLDCVYKLTTIHIGAP